MKRIPIEDASEGMVLAKSVETVSGVVLYPAGITLDEKIIEKLKARDVDALWIEMETEPRFTKEEYLERVERAFEKVKDDPLMTEIKGVLLQHLNSVYDEKA